MQMSAILYQINVRGEGHLLGHVGFPDGLAQKVIWCSELYGNHDTAMHGLVKVIRSVGGQDDQPIMST